MSTSTENVGESLIVKHLRTKLTDFFKPVHLEVECESSKHNTLPGVEIHFRVLVVSDKFEGLTQLQRQRMVNKLLETELKNDIHALRIEAKKPSEYKGEAQVAAPACGGGGNL